MKALVEWLRRLATVRPEPGPSVDYFRVFVNGSSPLDVEAWLFSVDPMGRLPHAPYATGPESWSVLRLPDARRQEANVFDRHRLASELGCLLSLALGRRVLVPVDLALQLTSNQVVFQPFAHLVDQSLGGPVPDDAKERISVYLSAVAGLAPEDQETIGAASTAYQGALLLFDREPRAAYTLLIAGIETLAQTYGSPPTSWDSWESAQEWDNLLQSLALSGEQAQTVRSRLLADKHLRLSLTFRTYGAARAREAFWDASLEQWISGIDPETGDWLPLKKMSTRKIADVLPKDRDMFAKALAASYNLRSAVVHRAQWVDLMTLGQPFSQPFDPKRPLSFPVLRQLLAELIWVEIAERTSSVALPDFQLLRTAPNAA